MHKLRELLRKNKRLALVAFGIIAFLLTYTLLPNNDPKEVSLSKVYEQVAAKQVESAVLYDNDHKIVIKLKDKAAAPDGMLAQFVAESSDEVQERLSSSGVKFEVDSSNKSLLGTIFTSFWLWFVLIYVVIIFGLPRVVGRLQTGVVTGNTDFVSERPKERFTDVKGAKEAIEELSLYVDKLKDPKGHAHLELEQGVILHGPTGTGKTLLAKALAGEAGVEFYRLSGAALTSVFQNGTSSRVREMFSNVKKRLSNPYAPAVVFIDEIDGVATSRRQSINSSSEDRNSGVTALLHEIGILFEQHPNVVVIAATNRLHALDEALKRPGRLGLHIAMPDPDREVREQILRMNSTHLVFEHEDFDGLAGLTAHLSGASVAAVPRTAARIAHMRAKRARAAGNKSASAKISWNDLEQATMEVSMGKLLITKRVTDEDRTLAAVHESGHTILAQASPYHRPMIATVYPIKESGGSTWFVMDDNMFYTYDVIKWMLALDMGGRAAERIVFGDKNISTGAGHDLEQATRLALEIICQWGIFTEFQTKIDVDKWMNHPDAGQINEKVKQLIKEAEALAMQIITSNPEFQGELTTSLLDKKILHSKDLADLAERHHVAPAPRQELTLSAAA